MDCFRNQLPVGCAIGALQSKPPGVYIAMNGQVFDIDKVTKNLAKNRFEASC
jgi:L-asparaginase